MANGVRVDPRTLGARCTECPFADNCAPVNPVVGVGPATPVGVLIGEGPGPVEAREGTPFVGPTGEQLDIELAAAGLDRQKLFVVNATACQPKPGKTEAEMRKAVECCAPALKAQLAVGTRAIVPTLAMGRGAAQALGFKKGAGHGYIRQGRIILAAHPTFSFFYNPYEWGTFNNYLRKFKRLVDGQRKPAPERLLTNPTAQDLLALEFEGWPVACDVETMPPEGQPLAWRDFSRARLKTIAFGNKNWGLAFEWETAAPPLRQTAQTLVSRQRIIYHNGDWADKRVISRYGFTLGADEDTIDARRALVSTSRLGLGCLAILYDDPDPWKEDEEDEDAKGMVHTTDITKLLRYNAQDAVETARLWDGLNSEPEFHSPRVQALYQQHRRTAAIAAKLHTRGITVDKVQQEALRKELTELQVQREAVFRAVLAVPNAACNPNVMRAVLYKRYETSGLPNFQLPDPVDQDAWNEKGTIKVDQPRLLNVITDPQVPEQAKQIITAYWQAQSPKKALGTFIDSDLVREATGPDGRLRAGWNPRGTDTGRWSCSDPNLQNLSEKKKGDDGALGGDLPNVRRLYRAAPAHVLVHGDYSQLELRVRAAVMGDQVLAGHLNSGDVYSRNAIDWFGLPAGFDVKGLKPGARKASKTIHLGSQYAAGVGKVHILALKVDRTFKFAMTRALHAGFLKTYHRTVEWWREEFERVLRLGYSETRITGRRRYYPRQPQITDTANYPIQGTAADIANAAMIRLDALGLPLITQLHDAFDVECPEKDADDVVKAMRQEMERPVEIIGKMYVFPVEIKVAPTWDKV